jgi:hypothetical protein
LRGKSRVFSIEALGTTLAIERSKRIVIHRVNQVACALSAQKLRAGASEWNTFS